MTAVQDIQQKATYDFGKLPLTFWEYTEQGSSATGFQTKKPGLSIYFAPMEVLFVSKGGGKYEELVLQFLESNANVTMEGRDPAEGKIHYLVGNDPGQWRRNLPTYHEIIYRDLWAGIDLIFKGDGNKLKYDLVVHPSADIASIRLAYRGAESLSLDRDGNLQIHMRQGVKQEAKPVSYQDIDGERVPVESRFVLHSNAQGCHSFGFQVDSDYHPEYPIIIDPVLIYSTYLGGDNIDSGLILLLMTQAKRMLLEAPLLTTFRPLQVPLVRPLLGIQMRLLPS